MRTMSQNVISPKKLIEVALPLDILNEACVKDKNPFLKNHPRAIHLWWARRPLAAARNVIFSQLVNDPEDLWYCQNPGLEPNKQTRGHWTKARTRLFKIIEELSLWENTTNQEVLERARDEIRKSWHEVCALNSSHPQASKLFNPNVMPEFHDPFAGGGAIPLEAQRLGLIATATDLNPVAVIINKAMVEFPHAFRDSNTKHEEPQKQPVLIKSENRQSAIVQDLQFLMRRVRTELEQETKQFYPDRYVSSADLKARQKLEPYEGKSLRVIAWLWARTVRSPNPAFSHVNVPLISNYVLSRKKGHEAYVEPVIIGDNYRFEIRDGVAPLGYETGTKLGRGCKFKCLLSGTPIDEDYIKRECSSGRSGFTLTALVCEGMREKVYLSPRPEDEKAANSVDASGLHDAIALPIANDPRNLWCVNYGITQFDQLYTERQLFALSTISNTIQDIHRELAEKHPNRESYLSALAAYLACGLSQLTRYSCVNCSWNVTNENIVQAFGRQAIPMTWDFAECNPFYGSLSIEATTQWVVDAISSLQTGVSGEAFQHDARVKLADKDNVVISTDPPYYDNITYGDLSDFFYVWLRRTLRTVFPSLFSTLSVPKQDELIVAPYRHKTKVDAEIFFMEGMKSAIQGMVSSSHPAFPITIYYAFKQSETKQGIGTSSTGWETFLEAVVQSGLRVSGTWPMRTEKVDAYKSKVNALASSIVLACRPSSLLKNPGFALPYDDCRKRHGGTHDGTRSA